ncbi:MAG TPA: hypothetical protein PLU49_10960 [Saprospiraceae bacterium]|nr:hypothetical protein [Bacteroidota bacterium]HRQ30585.1 hypothetical protein [Saprospiraceae bacterium]
MEAIHGIGAAIAPSILQVPILLRVQPNQLPENSAMNAELNNQTGIVNKYCCMFEAIERLY